jgi:hypothetical protein
VPQKCAFPKGRHRAAWASTISVQAEFKKAIEAKDDLKRVPLDPRVPDKTISVSTEMSSQEQAELLQFLNKNSDAFAWSTSDLIGVSREVTEHKLQVNSHVKPKKQKLREMLKEKE